MPYTIKKISPKCWSVVNTETSKVHSRCTTKARAEAQIRLLRGIESGNWKPTGKSCQKCSSGGGVSCGGEIPWIENLHIQENPVVAVPKPTGSGIVLSGPYSNFIKRQSQAFTPSIKRPLFPQA